MKRVFVTIIVPTFNEEKNIENCLVSIKRQTYKNYEIIVVDGLNSRDNTYEISKKYAAVFKFGRERSQQRNYGVEKSKGKYIFFIDADMQLQQSVVSDCMQAVKEGCVSVTVPERSIGEGYWSKCKALEKNLYIGDDAIEAPRFFEKKLFLKVGGYNEKMISGEDWDLRRRFADLGKIGRTKSFINHYEGRLTLLGDLKKKLYYAKTSESYLSNNVKGLSDVLKFIFRPAYFLKWRAIVSDPFHAVGFIVMKFSELLVGGFGAIIFKKKFWEKLGIVRLL